MDERRIKRLVMMLVMAIVIIMFFKYLLTKAVTNLGNTALEKKHAAATMQASAPSPALTLDGVGAAAGSAASGEGTPISSVEATDH